MQKNGKQKLFKITREMLIVSYVPQMSASEYYCRNIHVRPLWTKPLANLGRGQSGPQPPLSL